MPSETKEWKVGDRAWWSVRNPVLTPVEPSRLAVVVVSVHGARARVEVQSVAGVVRDDKRLPGEKFTVTFAKLYPREAPNAE